MYPSGKYEIFASDVSEEMVEIAKRNAERAGVGEDIIFSASDYLSHSNEWKLIMTNPPYGKRLESDELEKIYKNLIREVKENGWGFITSYPIDVRFGLANKKLLNWAEECRFWYKK